MIHTADFAHSLLNYTLTVENSTVFALCNTSLESVEECFVQYGKDPYYQNLSSPISGPVNSKFPIPLIFDEQEMVYYHQITVKVNSSLDIIIRSSFVYDSISSDVDVSMEVVYGIYISAYQLGLIGCAFSILLATSIIVIVILLRKGSDLNGSHMYTYTYVLR